MPSGSSSASRGSGRDRAAVASLWEPFRDRYRERVRPLDWREQGLFRAFRFCAGMMLVLDCTYWAFTWDRLLTWRAEIKARSSAVGDLAAAVGPELDRGHDDPVLPGRAPLPGGHPQALPPRAGREVARPGAQHRDRGALRGGRQDDRLPPRAPGTSPGVGVLLSVMAASEKRELADLTKADFETWEAQTGRSPRVASSGVTMAQRVLGAMGHLAGESPRGVGGPSRARGRLGPHPAGDPGDVRAVPRRSRGDASPWDHRDLPGRPATLRGLARCLRPGGALRRRCAAAPH